MSEGKVVFHEEGMGRILVELARAYEPKQAMREFVTDSLDAKIPDKDEEISVILAPAERRIIISDNGCGMNYQFIGGLPVNVGFSTKKGKIDKRGEKGLGLLAFGSLGDAMQMITKPEEGRESMYNYMRWEIEKGDKGIKFELDRIKGSEVDHYFEGEFRHGTRTIIDRVDPHIMERMINMNTLAEWFSQLYTPALVNGEVTLTIGKKDKKSSNLKKRVVDPIEYQTPTSTSLMNGIIEVPIKNEEGGPGKLEVLLFVDPNANGSKVAVYSKDVLVYDSLTNLEEFKRDPIWGSGKVSGYINDRFNRLILGRDGIDRQRNAFKSWYNAVQEITSKIRPIVEEQSKVGRKKEQDEKFREVYDAFCETWKELGINYADGEVRYRSKDGELAPVSGVSPNEGAHSENKGDGRENQGTDRDGPGIFRLNPNGHLERTVSRNRRVFPFGQPVPIPFPVHENNLRSKLGEYIGDPVIYVNETHPDFESRVVCRGTKEDAVYTRYLVDVMASETAYYAAQLAEMDGRLKGTPSEIASRSLKNAEAMRFRVLSKLGIK